MKTTTTLFTSKAQYLTWRKTWRANYAELSAEIRQTKADIKQIAKSGGLPGVLQRDLLRLRAAAASELAIRKESLLIAQTQYLEGKRALQLAKAA